MNGFIRFVLKRANKKIAKLEKRGEHDQAERVRKHADTLRSLV